jgi:predicted glutamine amidotransferase
MCELLAVAWDSPQPFVRIVPWAQGLERVGIAGFGWGLAWLAEDGVHRYRHPTSLAEDPSGVAEHSDVASTRFLVHLRRPDRLSTVEMADSQPFLAADGDGVDGPRGVGTFAFCHNGSLKGDRAPYAGRLKGRADSEVGFCLLTDLLGEGVSPEIALPRILQELGGKANFGYLGSDGRLLVYEGNRPNPIWRFSMEGARVAATQLHSDDESLFDLLFQQAGDRERVLGTVSEIGPPAAEGNHAPAAGRELAS